MTKKELELMLIELRQIVTKHLEESGSIRTDLAWLKKAFWTLVGLVSAQIIARIVHGG